MLGQGSNQKASSNEAILNFNIQGYDLLFTFGTQRIFLQTTGILVSLGLLT
jgi:hypothetical protein